MQNSAISAEKKAYLPTYLACNKDTKHFEKFHSRKFSPKQQLEDVFYRLMHRSDPVVQQFSLAYRIQNRKREETIPKEVLELCRPLDPN